MDVNVLLWMDVVEDKNWSRMEICTEIKVRFSFLFFFLLFFFLIRLSGCFINLAIRISRMLARPNTERVRMHRTEQPWADLSSAYAN